MTFSADAWARNLPLYESTRDMRFNTELAAGTLPLPAFRHYIVQDAQYLIAFAQALAVAAAKANDPDHIVQFAQAAAGAIAVERGLHTDYFHRFGLSAEAVASTELSPVCHHYASFLLATAFREPLPVLLAAMLPCFWIYREVGHHIYAQASVGNPYRAWIDTYAGEEFSMAVDLMIATTDALAQRAGAEGEKAMHHAFTRAVQLEWMFWESAYVQADWPLQQ